jgi:tRNA threonylcarbamoyladenosine biosynthesis protein TsaE
MAEGLGIKGYITSPTFTIVNEYDAYIPLYHFDVYRLSDPDEMFEIGFEEYLYGNGVVVIEWADMIKDILPRDYIRIEIKKDIEKGVDERIITIEFLGEKYEGYESQLTINNEE